jgi:hypothetical protein
MIRKSTVLTDPIPILPIKLAALALTLNVLMVGGYATYTADYDMAVTCPVSAIRQAGGE